MEIKLKNLSGASSLEIAKGAAKVLLANKGLDVAILSVSEVTVITDYYVIATARSATHINSLSGELLDKLAEAGIHASHVEGRDGGEWLLLDFDHVIVHVFGREARSFYNIERLGGTGIDISEIEKQLDLELSATVSEQ